MRFDADLTACAQLVERADPDRFMATMAAPVAARQVLFAIYAMNAEVARAPWVTQEPMIAEMRLQWWRDAIAAIAAQGPAGRHYVTTPLSRVLRPELAAELDHLVAARRWDIYRMPFDDTADFDRYLDATAATLVSVSARALGPADDATARDFGWASGLAGWFRAVPELMARGRVPLLDGTPRGIRALAGEGLRRLAAARARRGHVSAAAAPALLAGWQTAALLARAEAEPDRITRGALGRGGIAKRLSLIRQSLTGRW